MKDPLLRFGITMADSPEIETRLRGLLAPGKPAFAKPATLIALTGLGVVALSVLGVHYRTRPVSVVESQPTIEVVKAGATSVTVADAAPSAAPTEVFVAAAAAPAAPEPVEAAAAPPPPEEAPQARTLHRIRVLRDDAERRLVSAQNLLTKLRRKGATDTGLVESQLKVQRETYEALLRREQDLTIQREVGVENWPARETRAAPATDVISVAAPAAPPAPTADEVALQVRRSSLADQLIVQEDKRREFLRQGWRVDSAVVKRVDLEILRTRTDLASLDTRTVREARR